MTWDNYFFEITKIVAKKSSCIRRQVGAIIVKNNRILTTGYNGTPKGLRNCNKGGCPRCNSNVGSGEGLDECMCLHGEENAILQAAQLGIAVQDSTLYTTHYPCFLCKKMIMNVGINIVKYIEPYGPETAADIDKFGSVLFMKKLPDDIE